MPQSLYSLKIRIAADELIQRFGKRANIVASQWANSAFERGETAKYEFWQWVCMDIQDRDYRKARMQKQIAAGEALMDRYGDVFTSLAH